MKRYIVLALCLATTQVLADQSPSTANSGREPTNDFTKAYLERIAEVPHQLEVKESEDSSYHDKVLVRFSKMR